MVERKDIMKSLIKKITAFTLSLALVAGAAEVTGIAPSAPTAQAAVEDETDIISLGTSDISDPKVEFDKYCLDHTDKGWVDVYRNVGEHDYVYYGSYNGKPVKYRVLDKDSLDYGVEGGSMLLDCDTVVDIIPYKQETASGGAVALKDVTTTAKDGTITIPKTVKVDGVIYKVTTLKKGLLKKNKKKPKKLIIKASGITSIEKGAFKKLAKTATILIKAGKKDYKRIKKLIKTSGVGKGVVIKKAK